MKRAFVVAVFACWNVLPALAQKVASAKDIYRINCGAIVQITTDHGFGVGFIVSADGLIMTANHVITTPESRFRQYAGNIKVFVQDHPAPFDAKSINSFPSEDQVNYDSGVVKIKAAGLPHVTLGNWRTVELGDKITIIPRFPNFGCMLLSGTTAGKGPLQTFLGPRPVGTIIFQAPIRDGFSGSPIFDKYGRVVGIEDTKVFGISPALGQLRNAWEASAQHGEVDLMGINIGGSFIQVINNLDQNLISGLGSGVDISYAKQLESDYRNKQAPTHSVLH